MHTGTGERLALYVPLYECEDIQEEHGCGRTLSDRMICFSLEIAVKRQRVTKGPGSRTAGIAVAYRLIQSAQRRWRAVNAPHLVGLVRAGARFKNRSHIERDDDQDQGDQLVS